MESNDPARAGETHRIVVPPVEGEHGQLQRQCPTCEAKGDANELLREAHWLLVHCRAGSFGTEEEIVDWEMRREAWMREYARREG